MDERIHAASFDGACLKGAVLVSESKPSSLRIAEHQTPFIGEDGTQLCVDRVQLTVSNPEFFAGAPVHLSLRLSVSTTAAWLLSG
jgi:hypothetical protein